MDLLVPLCVIITLILKNKFCYPIGRVGKRMGISRMDESEWDLDREREVVGGGGEERDKEIKREREGERLARRKVNQFLQLQSHKFRR